MPLPGGMRTINNSGEDERKKKHHNGSAQKIKRVLASSFLCIFG